MYLKNDVPRENWLPVVKEKGDWHIPSVPLTEPTNEDKGMEIVNPLPKRKSTLDSIEQAVQGIKRSEFSSICPPKTFETSELQELGSTIESLDVSKRTSICGSPSELTEEDDIFER